MVISLVAPPSIAALEVKLIETSPVSPMILAKDQALYVHIQYQSNEPLRFQARGLYGNAELQNHVRYNPSQVYAAGSGEAIAWIAYDGQADINKIRVNIYNEKWQLISTQDLALTAQWSEQAIKTHSPMASWVTTLNNAQQSSASAALTSADSSNDFLVLLLFLSVPGYFLLQIYTLIAYKDKWKKAASIPLWLTIPIAGFCIFSLFMDSNLWPLLFIFLAPFGFFYLCVLIMMKIYKS